MTKRRLLYAPLLTFLTIALGSPVFLIGGGPNNVLDGEGKVLRWNPDEPVLFTLDRGSLGTNLTLDQAANLIRSETRRWENIDSATVHFQDNGYLPTDINEANYEQFIFGQFRPENPIIFDHDGSIIEDFLGSGTSESVLGFAGVRSYKRANGSQTFNPYDEGVEWFNSGWAVLNGKRAGNTSNFRRTVVHELGHMLGLDHTQSLIENYDEAQSYPCGTVGTFCANLIPLMFPILYWRGTEDPIEDDVAWFSWLYPTNQFKQTTGAIRGTVLRRSGGPFQGANVVAVSVEIGPNDEIIESRGGAISVASDYLMRGTGEFELPGLQPGDYVVFIDPIEPQFIGGSGVGPYDSRPSNFPRDYYNLNESAEDDPTEMEVIHVEAGQVVSGINLVANEVFNRLDLLGDDDEMLYQFPEGFRFPFYGKVYDEVVVNSDGNLTFGEGDGKVGDPRTEQRFLSGPPRIGPLFTDMDPSAGGDIRAQEGEGWIKFIWNGVPEYVLPESPPAQPNTFTVTLFSDGNIEFEYVRVSVSPDPSEEYPLQKLQAVVGIAPGGQDSGVDRDLSSGAATFAIQGQPVYEVFPGTSFDLEGRKVFFQAETHQILFPLLRETGADFTGFALTNYGEMDASLSVEARADDGILQASAGDSVEAGKQIATLGREYFDSTEISGWVRMRANHPELGSFFLFGNGTSQLDGSVAVSQQSKQLYFTRLYSGPAVFPTFDGLKDASTSLSVANPNEESIALTLRLYNATGNQIGLDVVRNIQPLGALNGTLAELFSLQNQKIQNGFVSVTVDSGPGAIGFEYIQLPGTLMGLNAAITGTEDVLYSAQLAHANFIFTSVKLVNPTSNTIAATLKAFVTRDDGNVDEFQKVIQIIPNNSFQATVDQIFGFPQLPATAIVGSIRVDSSDEGLIGDVIFGDPNFAKYAAALPLQSDLFTRALFSQVSNGKSSIRALNAFTGLALFNPNSVDANIEVSVYDRDGVLVGDPSEVCLEKALGQPIPPLGSCKLAAGQRVSLLLTQLVEDSDGLVRGYIEITSDQPIVAQELFGNLDLDYMSAVPPKVIE